MRHVGWAELAFLLDADVDVEEGFAMAWKPTGLDGDGPSRDGPLGAVLCQGHTSACKITVSSHLRQADDVSSSGHPYMGTSTACRKEMPSSHCRRSPPLLCLDCLGVKSRSYVGYSLSSQDML